MLYKYFMAHISMQAPVPSDSSDPVLGIDYEGKFSELCQKSNR